MMMGTADEIVKAPEKAIVFAEDLPEEEQATNLVNLFFIADYKCNSRPHTHPPSYHLTASFLSYQLQSRTKLPRLVSGNSSAVY